MLTSKKNNLLKIAAFLLLNVQLAFSQCGVTEELGGQPLSSSTNLEHGERYGFITVDNDQPTVNSVSITNKYDTNEQNDTDYYELEQDANNSRTWYIRLRGLNNSVSLNIGSCTFTFTVTDKKEVAVSLPTLIEKTYDGTNVFFKNSISAKWDSADIGTVYNDETTISPAFLVHWETSAADANTYNSLTAVFSGHPYGNNNFFLAGDNNHMNNYSIDPSPTKYNWSRFNCE